MKHRLVIQITLLTTLLCSCQSNTGTGVLSGASVGASFGGMRGGGAGALIGSAAGVIAGGLIGAALDSQDRKVIERSSPRTVHRMDHGEPLTINDVIKLSRGGVSDDAIIEYMQETETSYHLSQAQIRRLQEAGVSQKVLDYMIESGR